MVLLFALAPTANDEIDGGFTPMFHGRNLDGWVNVNCHPSTFVAKDDEIVTRREPDKEFSNWTSFEGNRFIRLTLRRKGDRVDASASGKLKGSVFTRELPKKTPFALVTGGGPVEFMNIFVRELRD